MRPAVRSICVYLDVHNSELKERVVRAASNVCLSKTVPCGCTRSGADDVTQKSLVEVCEAERNDVEATIQNTVPSLESFECFVTDSGDHSVGADVAYALYARKIPVLSLAQPPCGTVFCSERAAPLFHTTQSLGCATAEDAVQRFFTFPAERGRVFVFEGGDGSGKETQTRMLIERLRAEGRECATLDFPHDRGQYGHLIRELLSGKKGSIRDVNPLLFSSLYAINRHDSLPLMRYWLQRGYNVVLDRYMTANFGHQASKYSSDEERNACIATLQTFEVEWLGLPRADRVLYLDLPPEYALRAMKGDATRERLDIHELASIDYKERVRSAFLWCCDTYADVWTRVACIDDAGNRLSREEVHNHVYDLLSASLTNNTSA